MVSIPSHDQNAVTALPAVWVPQVEEVKSSFFPFGGSTWEEGRKDGRIEGRKEGRRREGGRMEGKEGGREGGIEGGEGVGKKGGREDQQTEGRNGMPCHQVR